MQDDYDDEDQGDYALDDMPEQEELTPDREERRESNLRMAFGLSNFLGVIMGAVAILFLLAVLISLLNWVYADFFQFFSLMKNRV